MKTVNRREFMQDSLGAAAGLTALSGQVSRAAVSANNKIVLGVMGLGGRGTYLAEKFAERDDVEVAYLCDPNTHRFARTREAVEEWQERQPKMVQDFRRILDDPSVDALVNATPDHWHALGSILACQAGKDVFVEKPMCHNIWEGRKMIEAVHKYERVLQVGMQSRSAGYTQKAVAYVQSGALGKIHLVRVFNMMRHRPQRKGPDQPVPAGFDYEIWCGPAPKRAYNPSYHWLNQWDYSCGAIAGDAIHQLDLARYLLGDLAVPSTVSHAGGINVLQDGRDIPDTQLVTYEYDDLTLLFEAALWQPYMQKIPGAIRDTDRFPDWPFCSTRVELLGTEGFMYYGRHGGGWQAYDAAGKLVHSEYGRQGDQEHQDNFFDCIRTRKQPNANVEQSHYSTLLCHLANISYRVGNHKLRFDPDSESFPHAPEANQFLKREYRKQWAVPDPV